MRMENLYQLFELADYTSLTVVKARFRVLVRQHQPDSYQSTSGCEDRMKRFNEAYRILGNPSRKKRYDLRLENWHKELERAKKRRQANEKQSWLRSGSFNLKRNRKDQRKMFFKKRKPQTALNVGRRFSL